MCTTNRAIVSDYFHGGDFEIQNGGQYPGDFHGLGTELNMNLHTISYICVIVMLL